MKYLVKFFLQKGMATGGRTQHEVVTAKSPTDAEKILRQKYENAGVKFCVIGIEQVF